MKKLFSLLLVIALAVASVFAFTSCANPNPEDTLVCGVTEIPGLNERDASGEWTIGFETEFAMAVAEKLGMKIKFVEIDWGQKYNEVNSNAIDAIWNGFTANASEKDGSARNTLVDFSYGYMLNQQCVVVKANRVAEFANEAALAGKTGVAEAGSAGETYATSVTDSVETVPAQVDTFIEVKSGGVDFAVVDIVLAQNVVGKGDFADLAIVEAIELESEVYAVGFKTGSELTAKVNAAIEELFEDGTMAALAEKYGFENVVKLIKDIEF